MITFVFGFSGSGKTLFCNKICEKHNLFRISVSKIVKQYGIEAIKKDSTPVVDDIINLILSTENNVVIDGIRQFDMFEKIIDQCEEKTVTIFIDNDCCVHNLVCKRGLSYPDAYNKIKLDYELGIMEFRAVSDYIFDGSDNEYVDFEFNEVIKNG